MTIGRKIRRIREIQGFSQEEVAEKLSMSPNGYGKIERDEVSVNHERLEKISKVLNTTVSNLLANDEKVAFNINTVSGNNGNFYYQSERERELMDKLLIEKDKLIAEKDARITLLEEKVKSLLGFKDL